MTILYQELITDVTGIEAFINLEKLKLSDMGITHLDVSNATNLRELELGFVSIDALDLSNNTNLTNLHLLLCDVGNSNCDFPSTLTTLDLSNNILLNQLLIFDTEIINLDLSNNPDIGFIEITRNNSLNSINFKNGNNSQTFWLQFTDNLNLECVQVDDPEAVIAGVDPPYDNWVIENNPIISEDCFLGLEDYGQKGVVLYPNPVKDVLSIESATHIKKVKIYTMFGLLVKEVTANFREISLAELPTGLLVVEISTEKGGSIEKIVKE